MSALARGNGGSGREERQRERERKKGRGAKTARKRRSGGCRRSDGDSENARAKGYEMKFSSHPFCVSEGIPVRQEVPSRNRRKRKKNSASEEEKGGKDKIGEEGVGEGRRAAVDMAVKRGRTGVAGYRTRGGFHGGEVGSKGNCQQSSDCIVVPKGKVHRPFENLLTYGNRTHLPFTLLFAAQKNLFEALPPTAEQRASSGDV